MKPTPDQLAAGWYPFWRSYIEEDPWFTIPYAQGKLLIWIRAEAAHAGNAPRRQLKVGQIDHSLRYICNALAWLDPQQHKWRKPSQPTVLADLGKLEEQGFISRQDIKNRKMIITICDYKSWNENHQNSKADISDEKTTTSMPVYGTLKSTEKSTVSKCYQSRLADISEENTNSYDESTGEGNSTVKSTVKSTEKSKTNNVQQEQLTPPPPGRRFFPPNPYLNKSPNPAEDRQPKDDFEKNFAEYWQDYIAIGEPLPWPQLDLWRRTVGDPVVLCAALHLAMTGMAPENPLAYLPSLFASAKAGELATQRSHPLCRDDPLYRVPGVVPGGGGNGRASGHGLEQAPSGQPRSRLASEIMAEMLAEPDADLDCDCLNGWNRVGGRNEPCLQCERGRFHAAKRAKGRAL